MQVREKERAGFKKRQLCVNGLNDILQKQIGRFYTSKLPVFLHLMPEEIPVVPRYDTNQHTYFVASHVK